MKQVILSFLIVFSFATNHVIGQVVKIGVFYPTLVFEKSQQGKKMTEELETYMQPTRHKVELLQKQVLSKSDNLRTNSANMSEGARQQANAELQELEAQLQRITEDAQKEYSQQGEPMMRIFSEEIQRVITQIGKEQGFAIIFNAEGYDSKIVYYDQSIDLTNDIIMRLDE